MKTMLIVLSVALTSCGGTFTLRPDMSLSYTTPIIVTPPINATK